VLGEHLADVVVQEPGRAAPVVHPEAERRPPRPACRPALPSRHRAISPAATLIFAGPVPEVAWGKRRPRAARSGRAGPFGGGGEDPAERLDLGPQPGGGQRVPLQPAETVLDQLQLGGPEPGERAARLPRGHLPLLLLAPLPG